MSSKRHGERQRHPFRSERISCENGMWYFQTREGTLIGPCDDREEARQQLAVFLAKTVWESPDPQHATSSELVGAQDGIQELVEELLEFYRLCTEVNEAAAHAWAIDRVAELRNDWKIKKQKERIDILSYAMDRDQRSA